MSKKKEKTASTKAVQKDGDNPVYGIYLTLNGNNSLPNLCYLRQCLEHANEYGVSLYVNGNAGNPPNPPKCPPGWPCGD